MQTLLDNWLGWLGLGGIGVAAIGSALWFMGLMPIIAAVLNIFNVVLSILSPFLNMLAQSLADSLLWFCKSVLLPGIKDIIDSWATIFTVITMGCFLWFGLIARYEVQKTKKDYVISQCKNPIPEPETDFELPWPFKWK